MKRDRELNQEIAEHIEEKVAELREAGIPEAEARARAHREFGNATLVAEKSREVWRYPSLDRLWQDLRYGFRMMLRNPGFTAFVVLTLALGIGVNTAIFSVANAVLLEPLPYPNPERLMWIADLDQRFHEEVVPGPDYFDWRKQSHSLEAVMAFEYADEKLTAGEDVLQIPVAQILGDFWTVMGVHPILGRPFTPGEPNVVILSYRLFERQFKGDPHVVGSVVTLGGNPATVIGVMPKDFRFCPPRRGSMRPRITSREIEAFLPDATPALADPPGPMLILSVVGKRKPEAPIESVEAELGHSGSRHPRCRIFTAHQLRVAASSRQVSGETRAPRCWCCSFRWDSFC